MSSEERDALRKVILAIDFLLWQKQDSAAQAGESEISKHRQALVDAANALNVWNRA